MIEFPTDLQIPLAKWVDQLMDWMLAHFGGVFDVFGKVMLFVLVHIDRFFLWIPWPVVVLCVGALGWKALGKWWHGLILASLLLVIGNFGYWQLAMMTLSIVTASVVISLVIGVPMGILMAWSDWVESLLRPLLDAMQTMPSFVYLIPALMFFGLGKVPAVFATIIYAMPPVIRLTDVGIRQVPKSVVEAAEAFGSSPRQILFNVQLPLARPSIMVGINQTTMMALSMVVVASMIGARGLGLEVLLSINRIQVGRGFEAGLSIVFLAIIIDRITHAMATKNRIK
ncbi:ABC transporter permease [Desulforhabdus amnigena]|uniref:ABC transporter permease n=1 Tax=Desulforhabdus amnigena TaxID=40218 RepID=A0A9W6D2S2_9BACT|nr:proline/glycine betaine ABC transporter permease [Desulforhabdus amnigena]GLI33162.1 ABC transporter permease [Desulforhabdus amnigena]